MRHPWRRFVVHLLAAFLGGSVILFVLLALADPWGTLPFKSPIPRLPADHSQRWAYPELAREPRFDAAIIGDSASRLLNPADLDPAVGARFVNLAMIHGFAWEQGRMLDLFMAAHPQPKAVLIGLDRVWCERTDDLPHFGYDPTPEWLYAGGWLRPLAHLFNMHAIETVSRSVGALLGLSPRPYGANGWSLIDVDFHRYDPALAHELIAQGLAEPWPPPPTPDPARWPYVALGWLQHHVDAIPTATRVLLVFVPRYHLYPAPGSVGGASIDECKRRVVAMARNRPNTEVYDMSLPDRITTQDDRWWDAVHARPETMALVSRELASAIRGEPGPDVAVLVPAAANLTKR